MGFIVTWARHFLRVMFYQAVKPVALNYTGRLSYLVAD
jgi:hypothetical protein